MNDRSGLYVPPQNKEIAPMDSGSSVARNNDMQQKMMRTFNVRYHNVNDMRGDIYKIRQKVNIHAVSIKDLELQMAELYIRGYS